MGEADTLPVEGDDVCLDRWMQRRAGFEEAKLDDNRAVESVIEWYGPGWNRTNDLGIKSLGLAVSASAASCR